MACWSTCADVLFLQFKERERQKSEAAPEKWLPLPSRWHAVQNYVAGERAETVIMFFKMKLSGGCCEISWLRSETEAEMVCGGNGHVDR